MPTVQCWAGEDRVLTSVLWKSLVQGKAGLAKLTRMRDIGLSKRKAWHDEDDDDVRYVCD